MVGHLDLHDASAVDVVETRWQACSAARGETCGAPIKRTTYFGPIAPLRLVSS